MIDIVRELEDYGATVAVHDPVVDAEEARDEFGLELVPVEALETRTGAGADEAACYDAAILAVAHRPFVALGASGIRHWLKPDGYLYDVKYALEPGEADARL